MRYTFLMCALVLFFINTVHTQPDIDPSELSHDFGPVGIGLSSDWGLYVANRGDESLVIHSATFALPEFTIDQPTFPRTIAPGGSLEVSVLFQPSLVGIYSDTLSVMSTDPDEAEVRIHVIGEGVPVVNVTVPDTSVPAGSHLVLPIVVDDVSGLNITSAEMRLVFDKRILGARGASNVGTIAEFWDLQVDTDEDQIWVHMSGAVPPAPAPPLGGHGILVFIDFQVFHDATPGQSTPVVMGDMVFNEGVPVALPHDGSVTVAAYTLSGRVSYYKHQTPVNGVLLTLEGGVEDSVWSDDEGLYQFDDIPGGRDYTVTPSKSGGVRTAINSYDAALVLRYIVDQQELDSLQLVAADVTGSQITSYDVSHILRFRVGIIDAFPIGKEWLFIPQARDYGFLASDLQGQNYTALVYGDVSGNWSGAGAGKEVVRSPQPRIVVPEDIAVVPGDPVTMPVLLEGADGIISADIQLKYDSALLDLVGVERTPFTSAFMIQYRDQRGRVDIALAGAEHLEGGGTLVRLTFLVSPAATAVATLSFEISGIVNEDIVAADHVTGLFMLPESSVPEQHSLSHNYPNPFNATTKIGYALANIDPRTNVSLIIYNVLGQDVRTLVDELQQPGYYNVLWDGRDDQGREVHSGVYYCQLRTGSFTATRKVLLLR
ncbi:MAG: T9SS type A sorting domain-containing protein [Gemmatimonadota bacterium]|nr:MAG: T9SS type A sorting domain-containing protein [Gemmatimonadota bacterium]